MGQEKKEYRLLCEACPAGLSPGRRLKLIREGLSLIKKGKVEKGVDRIGQAYLENREKTGFVGTLFVCREPSCEKECYVSDKVPLRLSHLWLYKYMHYKDMRKYPEIQDKLIEDMSEEEKNFVDMWWKKQKKQEHKVKKHVQDNLRKEEVVIVGAGPGGVVLARKLAQKGIKVYLYEKEKLPGGVMKNTMPGFHLHRDILKDETKYLLDHPLIEKKFNYPVTPEEIFKLHKEGKRIALAFGSGESYPLNLRDENTGEMILLADKYTDGALMTMDFLYNAVAADREDRAAKRENRFKEETSKLKKFSKNFAGKNIVVVGGGNVAVDAARVAWRLVKMGGGDKKNSSVKIICLEKEGMLPAHYAEIKAAVDEGVEIVHGRGIKKLNYDEGKLKTITTRECTSLFDSEGKFNPQFKAGTEKLEEVDVLIPSVGIGIEHSVLDGLVKGGIEIEAGRIKINPDTNETSIPGIYAVGDAIRRLDTSVINAIGDSEKVVQSILGQPLQEEKIVVTPPRSIDRLSINKYKSILREPEITIMDFKPVNRGILNKKDMVDVVNNICTRCYVCADSLMPLNLDIDYNRYNCIQCGVCKAVCYQDAIFKEHLLRNVKIDSGECINCLKCVNICPTGALKLSEEKEELESKIKEKLFSHKKVPDVLILATACAYKEVDQIKKKLFAEDESIGVLEIPCVVGLNLYSILTALCEKVNLVLFIRSCNDPQPNIKEIEDKLQDDGITDKFKEITLSMDVRLDEEIKEAVKDVLSK